MNPGNKSKKWFALWTIYLLFFNSGVLMFCLRPLRGFLPFGLALKENDPAFGWLLGMWALPAVILALAGGLFLDRRNMKKSGTLAGLIMLAGSVLFNFGLDYWSMLAGRFLIGTGAILVNLTAVKMLSVWFRDKHKGLAMSILHTGWPLSAILAYSTFVFLGSAFGWQGSIIIINIFILATLLSFIGFAPTDPEGEAPPAAEIQLRQLLSAPKDIWLTALFWFGFTASMISIVTFAPDYLMDHGWGTETSNFITGMQMWTATIGSLAAGWLIDRFGRLKLYLLFPAAVCCLCTVGLFTQINPIPLMLMLGFSANFIPVTIFSLVGQAVPQARLGMVFGALLTFASLGMTLGSPAAGWLNAAFGNRAAGVAMSAGVFLFCSIMAFFLGDYRLAGTKSKAGKGDVQGLSEE